MVRPEASIAAGCELKLGHPSQITACLPCRSSVKPQGSLNNQTRHISLGAFENTLLAQHNCLRTRARYFYFLSATKRFTALSVLCIDSLMWLRTVASCECCRIQLPAYQGIETTQALNLELELKGSFDWMQITSKHDCRRSAGDIEFPVREDWLGSSAERGASRSWATIKVLVLWLEGGLWCEPCGREAGPGIWVQGEGLHFPFLLQSPWLNITEQQGCSKFNSKVH
jgi:hypothetical protein